MKALTTQQSYTSFAVLAHGKRRDVFLCLVFSL